MPLLRRKQTIAVAEEVTEGTMVSILASHAKYLVYDCKYKINPTVIPRQLNVTSFARKISVIGMKLVTITFSTEVVGAGTVDSESAWAIFMRGCGFKPTVNATVSVQYDPVTNAATYGAAQGNVSLTIWVYEDGVVKKARGCRGTGKLTAESGGIAKWEWEFTGIYEPPADAAYPALGAGFDANIPPLFELSTFTFQDMTSGTVLIKTAVIDIGNTVVPRYDATSTSGVRSLFVSDRELIGSIDPEQMLEVDWGATDKSETRRLADGTVGGLTILIGSTAGNKFEITAPAAQVQITGVEEGDRDGLSTNAVDLGFYVPLSEDVSNKEIRFKTL